MLQNSKETKEHKELLRNYEPVLRFSAGEIFFPMNVRDYIDQCQQLYKGMNKRKNRDKAWRKQRNLEEKLTYLRGITYSADHPFAEKEVYNLRLIDRKFGIYLLPKIALSLFVLFLTFQIVYGAGLLAGSKIMGFHLGGGEWVKIGLLALGIISYPFINADSKAHFAIILNLFGMFFFGTLFAVCFGILGLVLLAGFWVVYLVFWIFTRNPQTEANGASFTLKVHLAHGISLTLVTAAALAAGFILHWARPDLPDVTLVFGASAFLMYAMLLAGMELPGLSKLPKEQKSILVLAVVTILITALMVAGRWIWPEASTITVMGKWLWPADSTIVNIAKISLSAVALFWYAMDPFSITKPGPLEGRQRKEKFGWDFRILLFITIAFFSFTLFSWLFYNYRPEDIEQILTGITVQFLVSALNIAITLGVMGISLVSYFLDLLSGIDNSDAQEAKYIYDHLYEGTSPRKKIPVSTLFFGRKQEPAEAPPENKGYWYFGRVCEEEDWTVLLYNYFYAFNNWRSTARGMNNHEGDWEAVAVFLKPGEDTPYGVAYSQHHHGVFRYWEDVIKVDDGTEKPSHPVVYTALGSHANYPTPQVSPPSILFSGTTRKIVGGLESFIRSFRQKTGLAAKNYEPKAVSRTHTRGGFIPIEQPNASNPSTPPILKGSDLQGGSLEYAAGDGRRIGHHTGAVNYSREFKGYARNLPEDIVCAECDADGSPGQCYDWSMEVIDDDTDWVCYGGLWGRYVGVEGENGPQGPKWDRDTTRVRWGKSDLPNSPRYSLEWLEVLLLDLCLDESSDTRLRKRAFQQISAGSPVNWPE